MGTRNGGKDIEHIASLVADGQIPGFFPLNDSDDDETKRTRSHPNKKRDLHESYERFELFYSSQDSFQ